MASSVQQKHEVFLSFRGKDTRYNFTSHLHAALVRKGINTFIDDELERGEKISQRLLTAIEESKISVIVLSRNYASSSWCLDELCTILECKNTNGQRVVPIFYRVDPSHVRKQIGSFGAAFVKNLPRFKDWTNKEEKWRAALVEVANISGRQLKKDTYEAKFIEDIVSDVITPVPGNDRSKSTNMVSEYHSLDKISPEKDDWRIKVRVARIWDNYFRTEGNQFISKDMTLLDENDTIIHATISKTLVHKFEDKIKEGKVYFIQNFEVKDNRNKFRVVKHQYMIDFFATTSVKEIKGFVPEINMIKFDLQTHSELLSRCGNDTHLSDVMGQLIGAGPMQEVMVDGSKRQMRTIQLQDQTYNKVNITLWPPFTSTIDKTYVNKKGDPIMVIVTSTTVRRFSGALSLSTNPPTRIYLNLDIPECDKFKTGTHQSSIKATSDDWITDKRHTVSELLEILKTDPKVRYVNCMATIKKVEKKHGWYYVSCKNCKKKVEPITESRFFCEKCEKEVYTPLPRYRLQLLVDDSTGQISVVIFDKEAEKLLGLPLAQIRNMEEKNENEDNEILPQNITKVIGQNCIFRFRIKECKFKQRKPIITDLKVHDMDDESALPTPQPILQQPPASSEEHQSSSVPAMHNEDDFGKATTKKKEVETVDEEVKQNKNTKRKRSERSTQGKNNYKKRRL